MRTTNSSSGVQVGKYFVTVGFYKATDPPSMEPVSAIPTKYTNPQESGLEVEVKAKMDPVKLELTGPPL